MTLQYDNPNVIGFPKPKEALVKIKSPEEWPWDMELGKPHGVSGDVGVREPVDQLLDEREKTHGPYKVKAKIIQDLKSAMEITAGWERLSDMQKESLHMIAHKIGRILAGDPNVVDHWEDLAGYARLVSKSL